MRAQRLSVDVEPRIRAHAADGQHAHAFEIAIAAYGPELLGYLASMLSDEDAARELYAQLCADLWKGLPAFEWRSTFRTWAYAVARNELHRHRELGRRARRFEALSTGVQEISDERARTLTSPHLRTANKSKLQELRDSLDPDDRAILVLRIDRELEWQEIAEALAGASLSGDERARHAAALRKRFERIKAELRARAREAGLLDDTA
jgi:RNA polymerase sigma-70 factor, ECF subfamily